MKTANIHSIESFATLDGGGIRFSVFLQGCLNRCIYCHNPDTFCSGIGKIVTTDDLIDKVKSGINFYKNGGGVTASGGEPLLQSEFVEEFFFKAKNLGLNTCLDTSACKIPENIESLLSVTDTVMLDLKFFCEELYLKYVKTSIKSVFEMLDICERQKKKVWIRTVIVPNINDTFADLDNYIDICKKYKCVKKYELLAYHTLGEFKYKKLGIEYLLQGTPALTKEKLGILQKYADEKLTIKI